MKQKSPISDRMNRKGTWEVNLLELGIEFGVIIAVPLLLLIALGYYLDTTLGTLPLFILLGLFLSIGISSYGLYKKINAILFDLNHHT